MTLIALIVIGVLTIGLIVYLAKSRKHIDESEFASSRKKPNPNLECCGEHEVCEAETLLTLSEEIIYYSDEELDAYRGRTADDYSDEEQEEFREVLLTLQMHEVTGWLKSLGLRRIELPLAIRNEALMIVDDFRQIRKQNREKNGK